MSVLTWTNEDTERADALWAAYQQTHDISDRIGQTAGIDPKSGRIWFGESIPNVVRQVDEEGIETLLFFVRVGFDHYYRKGRRYPPKAPFHKG